MLPPGRERLATSPISTGTPTARNTTGSAVVALLIAMALTVPPTTITSGWDATTCAAAIWSCPRVPSLPRCSHSDVAAVLPAKIVKPGVEGTDHAHRQHAVEGKTPLHDDSRRLCRLLRPGGERCGEESDGASQEPTSRDHVA